MTVAADIIDRAYVLIGFKDPSEPLSAQDAQTGLNALNDLIDQWNTQKLFIYTISEVIANVSGLPITIGPSMQINTPRPIKMEDGSFARIKGLDYPIEWLTFEQYQAIPIKSLQTAIPQFGFYDGGSPTGNIYLYPSQTTATELHLSVRSQLTAFPDLVTDVPLVQGYKSALQMSLAEELSIGIREIPGPLAKKAALARRAIRQMNVDIQLMKLSGSTGSPLARVLSGS